MTPAEEIRAAADRLEALAGKATPGPWTVPRSIAVRATVPPDEVGWAATDTYDRVVVVQAQAFEGTRNLLRKRSADDLTWIAAMDPRVAAPLVSWLRSAAADYEVHLDDGLRTHDPMSGSALAFARLVNSGSS